MGQFDESELDQYHESEKAISCLCFTQPHLCWCRSYLIQAHIVLLVLSKTEMAEAGDRTSVSAAWVGVSKQCIKQYLPDKQQEGAETLLWKERGERSRANGRDAHL